MKKVLFGIIIGVLLTSWVGAIKADVKENAKLYAELPNETTWKIVVNPNSGFRLINAKGEEKSYSGSPVDWDIDLETGKCYYDR